MAANMAAESVNLRNFSSVLLMLTEFFSRKTIQLHWIIALAEKKILQANFFFKKFKMASKMAAKSLNLSTFGHFNRFEPEFFNGD